MKATERAAERGVLKVREKERCSVFHLARKKAKVMAQQMVKQVDIEKVWLKAAEKEAQMVRSKAITTDKQMARSWERRSDFGLER